MPGSEVGPPGTGWAERARLDPGNGSGVIRPRGMALRSVPVVVGVICPRSRAHPGARSANHRMTPALRRGSGGSIGDMGGFWADQGDGQRTTEPVGALAEAVGRLAVSPVAQG